MTQALAERDTGSIMEQVLLKGNLAELEPSDRVRYYQETCASLGLNPLTRPFEYITLNGKLTLYAKKDCTDQLRGIRGVSITKLERERLDELYVVTAYASDKHGRSDSAVGAVNVKGLQGENLANALMKAETKAKRRVTLSLCGLGWSDESEVDSIPSQRTIVVDHATGEVLEERSAKIAPTDSTIYAEADDDKRLDLMEWWKSACERAGELGISHKDLPENAPNAKIEQWTKALIDKINEVEQRGDTAA